MPSIETTRQRTFPLTSEKALPALFKLHPSSRLHAPETAFCQRLPNARAPVRSGRAALVPLTRRGHQRRHIAL
jgi:hypothetical protein